MQTDDERCDVLVANRLELCAVIQKSHTRNTGAEQTNRAMLVATRCTMCIQHNSRYIYVWAPFLCMFPLMSLFFSSLFLSLHFAFSFFSYSRTPLQPCNIVVKSISCSLILTVLPAFIVIFHLYRERYATLRLFYDIIWVSVCIATVIENCYESTSQRIQSTCVCECVSVCFFLWWIHIDVYFSINEYVIRIVVFLFGLLCAFGCYVPF